MRKIWIAICAVLASCLTLVGCGGTTETPTDVLATPVELEMNSKGVLSWDEVKDATAYDVVIGETTNTTEDTKVTLTDIITEAGEYTIQVTAKNETGSSEAATYALTAIKLPTPTKPVVETDPDTHEVKFVWTGGVGTRGYLQQVNGGKWVSNTEGFYKISSTGEYTIAVKAKSYATDNVLYLDSDASEMSDTYAHVQGPVLSLIGMGIIDWSVEDGANFDAFNLYVNGELARENVVAGETGFDLVVADDPVITKTGEYDIQLEAVLGGNSYWSNTLVEVGTYNINEGEIYSFDNRVAKFPVMKDGVSVSNEQFHGESGYSLRYEANRNEQINLVKYADERHENFLDYRTIKKVSYWVYIEPIEGFEGDMFPAKDLPTVKWEKEWKTAEGVATYKATAFAAKVDVPFGVWTKVEIDNIENGYENVLIMQYPKTIAENYVIYIDDITFEEVYENVAVDGAEYAVEFTSSANNMGAWFGYKFTELDFGAENANMTLTVSMQITGNVPANLENGKVGLFSILENGKEPGSDHQFLWIEADMISSLGTWNTITLKINTNSAGKCYVTGAYDQGDGKLENGKFDIFLKDVTVLENIIDGTPAPTGTKKTDNSNNYRQSFVAIPATEEVGSLVKVSVDIYVTGEFDAYTYIKWVDTVWSVAGGEVNVAYAVLAYDEMNANIGKWINVSFYAKVRSFDVLRMNSAYPTMDVSSAEKGVYLVLANFTSENSINYKNVTVSSAKEDVGVAVAPGTQKATNPNGYYQAAVAFPTTYDVGTELKVTMDIFVTGEYDQYSDGIYWVDSVYTVDGGEINAISAVAKTDKMAENKGQWFTVEFTATVRNFSVLRTDPSYNTIDMSAYGNAVYLFAKNMKSADTFNYKNVVMVNEGDNNPGEAAPTAQPKISPNGYYQSFVGLKTDYEVGTVVTVKMEIKVTGTWDQWSTGICWVDTVWTTDGGEVNAYTKIIDVAKMEECKGQWVQVEFEATVRNFSVLRTDPSFNKMDTSAYGNAVYLFARDLKSESTFSYRNVMITLK